MTLQTARSGFVDPSIIASVQERFDAVRRHSVKLGEPLSEEDCCAQSMPDASPLKWHLAHTTWFFETFILERYERNFAPYRPAFRVLFNSYYNGVGEKHPRAQRGLLTRPSLDEVLSYRHQVDRRIAALLHDGRELAAVARLVHIGLHHEQQHQELMVTDVMHLLSMNPLKPAYDRRLAQRHAASQPLAWRTMEGGVVRIGYDASEQGDFCFDNETPRHRQFAEPFALAQRLVTNGEYLKFVQAGGYEDPSMWMSEGWDWIRSAGVEHPLYWQSATENRWEAFTLHGMQPLDLSAPAAHLSWFEADAYARSVGARLPTEAEWECAVTQAGQLERADVRGGQPELQQVFGACWQWTGPGLRARGRRNWRI
jgi:ergothioneine biosynthesis protein EgtB